MKAAIIAGCVVLSVLSASGAHAEEPFPLTKPMRVPPRQSFYGDGKILPLPRSACNLEMGMSDPPYEFFVKSNCWSKPEYLSLKKHGVRNCPSEVRGFEQVDKATVYVQVKDICDAREKTLRFTLEDTKDLLITNVEAF